MGAVGSLCYRAVPSLAQVSLEPLLTLPQSSPDLGEDRILAGRVPRRAGTVLHGKAAVDVQPWHEAGLAAF